MIGMLGKQLEEDYKFILKIFSDYYTSYNIMLDQAEAIGEETIVWSDSYLEFYPFQYALNRFKKPRIYKTEPQSKEGIIVSKLKNGETYYASHAENNLWGTNFIIDEGQTKLCLKFINNEKNIMTLNQLYCIKYEDSLVHKVFSYMKDGNEENFSTLKYFYNGDNVIQAILSEGFNKEKSNVLAPCTYRFEYEINNIFIYAKQLKKNGQNSEQLMYKTR